MRTNAIIRIVLYSLVIIALLTILLAAFGVSGFSTFKKKSLFEVSGDSSMKSILDDHGSSPTAAVSPVDPSGAAGANTTAAPSNALTISTGDVREIEVEWVSGSITVQLSDVSEITITETAVSNPDYALRWKVSEKTLKLQYGKDSIFSLGNLPKKDLTILVPRDYVLDELSLDFASADVEITDMTIGEVEIDSASGETVFTNCTVGELDIDTASGDVTFSGTLEKLSFDSASASFIGTLTNTPREIEMDAASGDLELTLPADSGITLSVDGLNTKVDSDFNMTIRNGSYICGDGFCKIEVDGMSSSVKLHKG